MTEEDERMERSAGNIPSTPPAVSGDLVREMFGETWQGMRVAAYRWVTHHPDCPIEGLRERDHLALHWSTGPETADRLFRMSDVAALIHRREQQAVANMYKRDAFLVERGLWSDFCDWLPGKPRGEHQAKGEAGPAAGSIRSLTTKEKP